MIKVLIDAKFKITGRGCFICVKLLDETQNFKVQNQMYLGNFELEPVIEIPSRTLKNGQPDLNIYALILKNSGDFDKIKEGEILELYYG